MHPCLQHDLQGVFFGSVFFFDLQGVFLGVFFCRRLFHNNLKNDKLLKKRLEQIGVRNIIDVLFI